ncbi:starch branching enzyme III [Anopheles sinensis]|uniref:Starch branching enzyme III n=1 Tax=Anopheles sinensis TaxID=74873 RepID=A0A084WR68_ANOSI|nr:starch branching enzyme III [Anopheles sinensis]
MFSKAPRKPCFSLFSFLIVGLAISASTDKMNVSGCSDLPADLCPVPRMVGSIRAHGSATASDVASSAHPLENSQVRTRQGYPRKCLRERSRSSLSSGEHLEGY